jgi:lipopolysaccharide biosynthesis regulator YciM
MTTLTKRAPAKRKAKAAKPTKLKRQPTLAELNRWMEAHAQQIMEAAKKNTLRLTGKEIL